MDEEDEGSSMDEAPPEISLLGIARLKRQKIFLATYYAPEHVGCRTPALVKPILESNRVKMLLDMSGNVSYAKVHRIQLASGEALHIKVECAQLLYVLLTTRSYDPTMAEVMLTRTREVLMMKAEEKGIADMDQYFGSGALNMEVMVTSTVLKEIVDSHISPFSTTVNGGLGATASSTPFASAANESSIISSLTSKVGMVKRIMQDNISVAFDNVVDREHVEDSIEDFEKNASIFKRNKSKEGNRVTVDSESSAHCGSGDLGVTTTPTPNVRQWFRGFSSGDKKHENGDKSTRGLLRRFSRSKSPTDVNVKKPSFFSMITSVSTRNADSDNDTKNNQGIEELVSDDNNNNNNNNETLSRSTTTSNEDTSENLDFAQKPKSIRAKSPTVIVKSADKKVSSSFKGSRNTTAGIDSSRFELRKTNSWSPMSTPNNSVKSQHKNKDSVDKGARSDIHVDKKYKETDDKNIDNEIEISNIDDDDDDDIDSNEEGFPMPASLNSSKKKEKKTRWYSFGNSKKNLSPKIQSSSPPKSSIVVKRADTSTALLQQQYHNQQEQQKELKFSTPSILVKSNSWSPMNDTESEVCDIDINTIDENASRAPTLSADRRINVLSMGSNAGDFLYGLIWLGTVVDVEEAAFWTKKSKRTLLWRQSDASLTACRGRSIEAGKGNLMRSKSTDFVSRGKSDRKSSAGLGGASTSNTEEMIEPPRSKSADRGNNAREPESFYYHMPTTPVSKKVGFNSTEEEDEIDRKNKLRSLNNPDTNLIKSMKLGVSSVGSAQKGTRHDVWPNSDDGDDDDNDDFKIQNEKMVNAGKNLRGNQSNERAKGKPAVDVSEVEISKLRTQAIAALRESHGDLADHLFPDEITLKKTVDDNEDFSPIRSRKSPARHKSSDELKRENEKLRRLLEESLYDLPPVPNQESILSQRRHQKEIQSLNMRIQSIGKEEREKADIEIWALKSEIQSLKDKMREEKIKAEFAIDELLESSARQVLALQESHDLQAAEEKGRMAMLEEMEKVKAELNALRQEKRYTSSQAEESIQLIMESSSSQIFDLQEALDKSQSSVEALTRFVRELLRRPAGVGLGNEEEEEEEEDDYAISENDV